MRIRFAVLLLPLVLNAQVTPTPVDNDTTVVAPYRVVSAGPHERLWRSVTLDAQGRTNTHSYVEVATGLDYLDPATGRYEQSQEQFEITKDGNAVARKGQHQVILAADINTGGSVDLLTPDGQRLLSNPMGLSFHDFASGKNVLIAELTNCIGELVASNVIVYPNAFDTLKAAIRYTYTKSGFSQDIILYQNPGSPADYGLDPATTVLEMYSEFFSPPTPTVQTDPDSDQTLNFGQMRIGRGAAYLLNQTTLEEFPVTKEWAQIQGRYFLIEEAPYQQVKPLLDYLQASVSTEQKKAVALRTTPNRETLMALEGMKPKQKSKEVASVKKAGQPRPVEGFVLDYVTLNTSQTNYLFKGDTTYYISGSVSLNGTNTTFECGTVIKYTNNVSLIASTPITWQGIPYRPVIMTSKDDNSVGQTIPGSTGNPAGNYYAATALYIDANTANTNAVLQNLRIANAQTGIGINGRSGHVLSHAQFVTCKNGIAATNAEFSLRNALLHNVLTNFTGSSSTGRVEHLTVDTANWLNNDIGTNLYLTNCLLVAVANTGSYSGNTVSNVPSASGVFQAVGSGYHYLAANSPYRNVGTTNVNSSLAGALKKMTTYPPIVLTNDFTVSTVLSPQAPRDTDAPDIGYHYDPFDYCWTTLNLSGATLTLTNGVAVGIYGPKGTVLQSGATYISEGSPINLNHLAGYQMVQEQPVGWGTTNAGGTQLHLTSYVPAVYLRFTDVSSALISGLGVYGVVNPLAIANSQLRAVNMAGIYAYAEGIVITLTNNVLERCSLSFYQENIPGYYPITLYFYNNLFRAGSYTFNDVNYQNTWTILDNLFDCDAVSGSAYAAYNGYRSGLGTLGGAGNITGLTMDYQVGPLGPYYYPSSGTNLFSLVNAGSQNATNAGLYHFTTQVSQVKESNSVVDIGFHYVAVGPDRTGLVGWWKLDEAAGTLAPDSSGYGHDGTLLNGPTWTNGTLGGALSFDGVDDSVSCVESPALRLGTTMTIAFWVRKDANPAYYSMLVGKGSGNYRNYKVWLYTAGTLNFQFIRTDGVYLSLPSTTALQAGSWYHVACTYNGSTAAIYINGVMDASMSFSGTPLTSNDPLTFGYSGWNEFFKGALDDVRIYNRALSTNDIAALANKVWDFDGDDTPNYLEDRNGNGSFDNGETSWTNSAPVVTVTAPTNNQLFVSSPTNITITASALDDGTVTNVAFYNGTNLLGQDTASPYSLTWSNVTAGTYTLTAKATDDLGGVRASDTVTITVNAVPSVSITNPVNGAYFSSSPTNILLQATASDSDGTITNVAFYNGTNLLANVATSPYNYTWSNVLVGTYTFTAKATDNRGAVTTSSAATITVNGALDFGTNNAYVTFGTNANLGLKAFTLECWFKRKATGVSTSTGSGGINAVPLVTKGRAEVDGNNKDMNYFMGIGTNVLAADFEEGATGGMPGLNHPVIGVTVISNDLWYHAAATYDGNAWRLYLNGNLESQKIVNQPTRDDSIQHAALATAMDSTGTPAGFFYGVMDDVRIWSYARTGKQIRDNMNREISNECGLVAQWTLNEGTGTNIYSSTGTNVTGTLKTNGWSWVGSAPYKNGNVLFVVGSSPTNLSNADSNVLSRLQNLSYFVTTKAATNVISTNANDKSLVVISSTVNPADVNTKFSTNTVPVINWDEGLYDDFGMVVSNSTYYGTVSSQTQIDIVNPLHPLAAGLTGTVTVASNASTFSFGRPNTNAIQVATVTGNSSNYVIFAYEKGAAMQGLLAPARRVGLFLSDTTATSLNTNGWALFDAAINWVNTPSCPPVLDLMLVIDHSGSLTNQPLVDARNNAKYLATNMNLNLDRAGVVAFMTNGELKQPLTKSAGAITSQIDTITNTGPGSFINLGIDTAQAQLTTNHIVGAQPVIILFSDGKPTDANGNAASPNATYASALLARQNGTRIITVGLGSSVNTTLMQNIASSPCDYYYAPDTNALNSVLNSITNSLCRIGTPNQPPAVTLTSPVNGTIVGPAPVNVSLAATAIDPDGSISKVEFYQGSTKLGEKSSLPYSLVWSNVQNGNYALTARATNGFGLVSTSSVVTFIVNNPPTVNPGTNQTVNLPPGTVQLNGSVTDDGLPYGITNISWGKVSGPGAVNFTHNATNQAIAQATFSTNGTYTLILGASDNMFTVTSNLTVTVNRVNQGPFVNAGPDQRVRDGITPIVATLAGTVTDDGLPSGTTNLYWSKIAGPGSVTFGNSNALGTTVSFFTNGVYQLRLTATDSALTNSDDLFITVTNFAKFETFYGVNYTSAGVGGMRGVGTANLALSGLSGTVKKAYLYWNGPTMTNDPNANASVFMNGRLVIGINIGFSSDNCWGYTNSQTYRADVTPIVACTGNGAYSLTGFMKSGGDININGASLIVIFDDGNPFNDRDVVIWDGNDSNVDNPYDQPGWSATLSGLSYTFGTGSLEFHVADGQYTYNVDEVPYFFWDGAIVVNDIEVEPDGEIFSGLSVPWVDNGINGSLWDIRSFDITSILRPDISSLSITSSPSADCLGLVALVANLPAGAIQPSTNSPAASTATAPILARPDTYTVNPNIGPTILNVLSNDFVESGQCVSITAAGPGTNGLVEIVYNGSALRYRPNTNFSGADNFFYTISDGRGNSSSTNITLTGNVPPPALITCGQNINGTVATNDAQSLYQGPGFYADYYYFNGTAGYAAYIDISPADFLIALRNPDGVVVATGSSSFGIAYEMPTSGRWTIEVSTWTSGFTGNYSVSLTACQNNQRPEITVLVDGFSLTNQDTVYFGITPLGTNVTKTFTLTNSGTADLMIDDVYIVDGNFTVDPTTFTPFWISPGSATNLLVTFNATNSGPNKGTLYFDTNDDNEDGTESYFLINLEAIASAAGTAPAVSIINPANGSVFTAPVHIPITASAAASNATISLVDFFDTTSRRKSRIGQTTNLPYTVTWSGRTAGTYSFVAVVVDSAGRAAQSSSVSIQLLSAPPNQPPVAVNDAITVGLNSRTNLVDVLANDGDPNISDTVTIAAITQGGYGAVAIRPGSTNVTYTPNTNSYGYDFFSYTISDGRGGTATAYVDVTILAHPLIEIISPVDEQAFVLPTSVPIVVATAPTLGQITKVEYFADSAKIGESTTSPFGFTWNNPAAGFYLLSAVATDSNNIKSSSDTVLIGVQSASGDNPPIATLANLTNQVTYTNGNYVTNIAILREGSFDLTGTAYDPDTTANVAYRITVYRPTEGIPVADLTPKPVNAQGYHVGRVPTVGLLARLDFSLLRNDVYVLDFDVRSSGMATNIQQRFALENELKVGRFTFSQQDLVIPVNGFPLSVVRTYDSINPIAGDFGFGWTYAVNTFDVVLDEEREDMEEVDTGDVFSVRVGGDRNVTLTLPDGRRTTFFYYMVQGACQPGDEADFCLYPKWLPAPGINASLVAIDDPRLIVLGPLKQWSQNASAEQNFDFKGFILTTEDGTQFRLEREDFDEHTVFGETLGESFVHPYGKITRIQTTQLTGDKIIVDQNQVQQINATQSKTNYLVFQRDEENRIIAINDPNDLDATGATNGPPAVTYEYDILGNLTKVNQLVDKATTNYLTTTYSYTNANFPHYITGIEDARGLTPLRIIFDDAGHMVGTVDAFGNTNRFAHDLDNRIETIYDRKGNATTHVYDSRGNIISTTDAEQKTTTRQYDANNNLTVEVDSLNNTNKYAYDAFRHLTSATNALQQVTRFTYTTNGLLSSTTDERNNTTTNIFNSLGLLLITKDALQNATTNEYDGNGNLVAVTNALGKRTVTYQYDPSGRLTNSIDLAGLTNSFKYDANGSQTNAQHVWVNPTNASDVRVIVVKTYFDSAGRVVGTVDGAGNPVTNVFDAAGKITQSIDQLGRTNRYLYDTRGALIQTTYADGTLTRTAYEEEGRVSYSTDRHFPGDPVNGTHTIYDKVGRAIGVERLADVKIDLATLGQGFTAVFRSAGGFISATATSYDAAGRVAYTVDARGVTNAFGYDLAGGRTSVTNAWGTPVAQIMRFAFDANGNHTNMVDALNRTNSYFYDALNRRTNVTFPDGTKLVTQYDALSRRVAETDQATNTTWFAYDDLGRLTAVTNALSQVTKYQYDKFGNLTNQIDALNRSTKFEYDPLGRRARRILPQNQYESYLYDAVGNLTNKLDFNGRTLNYFYDAANRLLRKDCSDTGESVEFEYDALGRRTSMLKWDYGYFTYTYDAFGRLQSKTDPFAGTLAYSNDANGNVLSIRSSNSSGTDVTYQYDALNRLTNVIDARLTGMSITNTSYRYDGVGNLQSYAYPNGVTNLYQYDSLNRLTNLTWKYNGNQRGDFTYKSGPAGNRTNLADNVNGLSRTFSWQYDVLYRLTNETITGSAPTGTLTYKYDAVGNRTNRTSTVAGLGNQTPSYNSNDWLNTDTYDNQGNTTVSGGTNYLYDFENRLVDYNDGAVTFIYDGDGNRVKKVAGSTIIFYLVDDRNPSGYAQVFEELIQTNQYFSVVTNRYTYGLDLISQNRKTGSGWSASFYGYDGLGSTRFLTGTNSGAITDTYVYDAYGTVITNTGTTPNFYRYTGEQWDPDVGLVFLRARYYAPGTGRFWTMDTFEGNNGDPLSLHKYAYGDNPVNNIDPSGNMTMTELVVYTGIATVVLNAVTTGIATHLALKGSEIPKWVVLSFAVNGGAYGGLGEVGVDLVFNANQAYVYIVPAAGISPLTVFQNFNMAKGKGALSKVGASLTFGVIFNMENPEQYNKHGFTATWPLSVVHLMPKALFKMPKMWGAMTELAKKTHNVRPDDLVVQVGFSTGGPSSVKIGLRSNQFSWMYSYAFGPYDFHSLSSEWQDSVSEYSLPDLFTSLTTGP